MELKELIREANPVEEIASRYTCLDKDGERRLRGLCPLHTEKKGSFNVYPETQSWFCFGCGKGGDVFSLVMEKERLTFREALQWLARRANLPVPKPSPEEEKQLEEGRTIENILTETAQFYHRSLAPAARDYLTKERGLTAETISRYQIGYAQEGLREHLLDRHKFPLDLCLKAGVLKMADSNAVEDYFYHRVILPNLKRGRVVHLSGRSLEGQEPKYLHLPGEIRYLYNEDALSNREGYITEGILDCLSAVQAGFPTVAILGSSFKPEYLPKLSCYETVYLCLDRDKAGEQGVLKAGELIGERARVVLLPQGLDLNDYLKNHSKEEFERLTRSAMDIVKYELSFIPPDTDKTELPQRLEPLLKKLARMDKAKAEAYLSYEVKPRFKLKKEDIDGYRELVSKHRKAEAEAPNMQSAHPDAEPVYTALFDGLVDLVEHNGGPAFLIKEGDKLLILRQIERDGIIYIPPPKGQIPWLLPRGEEVLSLYELQAELSPRESDGALYDDLFAYHKAVSELPGEEY